MKSLSRKNSLLISISMQPVDFQKPSVGTILIVTFLILVSFSLSFSFKTSRAYMVYIPGNSRDHPPYHIHTDSFRRELQSSGFPAVLSMPWPAIETFMLEYDLLFPTGISGTYTNIHKFGLPSWGLFER